MKKLMILIAMMGFVGTTAFGQYSSNRNTQARQGKVYTDNWNNHRTSERSKRGVTQSVNLKQREIRGLIADGIMDGSITGREAKELLEASERIELKENRFMRNGRLTNRESKELRENLENLEQKVIRSKRNRVRSRVDVSQQKSKGQWSRNQNRKNF